MICLTSLLDSIDRSLNEGAESSYFNTTYKIGLQLAIVSLMDRETKFHQSKIPLVEISMEFMRLYAQRASQGRNNQRKQQTPSCPKIYTLFQSFLNNYQADVSDILYLVGLIDKKIVTALPAKFLQLLLDVRSQVVLKQPMNYLKKEFNLCLVTAGRSSFRRNSWKHIKEDEQTFLEITGNQEKIINWKQIRDKLVAKWNNVERHLNLTTYPNCVCNQCKI